MAGIGFQLEKVMERRTISGVTRAGLYAGIVAAGPWMISVGALAGLTVFLRAKMAPLELDRLTSLITHCYALALIISGPFSLILTRYAADRFFDGDRNRIFGSFLCALALIVPICGVAGTLLFQFGTGDALSPLTKASGVALLVFAAGIFTAGNYLTSLSCYRSVVACFIAGFGSSCALAVVLVGLAGPAMAFVGFTAGHGVLFVLLYWRMAREFAGEYNVRPHLAAYVRRFPTLVLIGLFYNSGLWIDKFLFWQFSGQSYRIAGWIKASPEYDLAIHLALATIVPGMAAYVLALETSLAKGLKRYRDALLQGETLRELENLRIGANRGLQRSFWMLVKVQGLTTLLVFLNLDAVCNLFGIGGIGRGVFSMTLLGGFLLVLFLSMLTVLFYLDDRKGALWSTLVFFATNAVISGATVFTSEAYYGLGFLAGAAAGLLCAFFFVSHRMESLHRQLIVLGSR